MWDQCCLLLTSHQHAWNSILIWVYVVCTARCVYVIRTARDPCVRCTYSTWPVCTLYVQHVTQELYKMTTWCVEHHVVIYSTDKRYLCQHLKASARCIRAHQIFCSSLTLPKIFGLHLTKKGAIRLIAAKLPVLLLLAYKHEGVREEPSYTCSRIFIYNYLKSLKDKLHRIYG